MATTQPAPAREGYLHESAPMLFGVSKAVFDASKTYRYRLSRTWGSSGTHATSSCYRRTRLRTTTSTTSPQPGCCATCWRR